MSTRAQMDAAKATWSALEAERNSAATLSKREEYEYLTLVAQIEAVSLQLGKAGASQAKVDAAVAARDAALAEVTSRG
jgi:hypothetical protein